MTRKFDKNRRNRDLIKKYNINEEEYASILAEQGGVCKICGKPPSGRPLHVEHCHQVKYTHLKKIKLKEGWLVKTDDDINLMKFHVEFVRRTKAEATLAVKRELLKLSIRGACCWQCNTMLKWAGDNPQNLRNGAKYLEDYADKFR
jgi:hypothetical protein